MAVTLAARAQVTNRTWTASGPGDSWGTANNWTPVGVPASTDTTYFIAASVGRTNILDQDRTISGLIYSNTYIGAPILGHLTDLGAHTLTVTNLLQLGYNMSNCVAAISNGTLQLGVANSIANVDVGTTVDALRYTNLSLTIYGTLNATNLGNITVASHASGILATKVQTTLLDLSGTTIISPLGANTLKMGNLWMGRSYGVCASTLKLPSTLTNIEFGAMFVPGDGGNNNEGYLDFGSNSQLRTLTARNGFYLGYSGAGQLLNWPTNVNIFIGASTNYTSMYVGYESGYGLGTTTFSPTNGSLTAYLTNLSVCFTKNDAITSSLDLRATSVQIGDELNKVKVRTLNVGGGVNGALSGVPAGTLTFPSAITDIQVGDFTVGDGYSATAYAILGLGANSSLTNMLVINSFIYGQGVKGYILGLPTNNWRFTVGQSNFPIRMRIASRDSAPSQAILAPTGCVFSAWLSELTMSDNTGTLGSSSSTCDLRRVTSVGALVVTGNVSIAADPVVLSNKTA